jgi:hypothetical protein
MGMRRGSFSFPVHWQVDRNVHLPYGDFGGKLGFEVEERDSAVEGNLKTVVFPEIAVGKRRSAVEKGGSAVWGNGSAVEKNAVAVG